MTRAALRRCAAAIAILALGFVAPPEAHGQLLEPPPEAPEGEDWEADPADSLADGVVEMGFGAAGRAGRAPARRRRLRYEGDELSAALREGAGDPLSGGAVEGRGVAGTMTVGRLAPLWGRGLLLGAAAEPWRRVPLDRGPRAAYRGRSGDGVALSRGDRSGIDALCGRFSRHDLGGMRARWNGIGLGALANRDGTLQSSLAFSQGITELEFAADGRGRWRAEALANRPLGEWLASARVRGGLDGFRSLAEPNRSGPARALGIALVGPVPNGRLEALAALWRFAPGRAGARAWLSLQARAADGSMLDLGLGEHHGSLRSDSARPGGFRQGGWAQWTSPPGSLVLALRHETWGRRAFAREATRSVSSVGIEARVPMGATLRASHSVYRVGSGESLYLPELAPDRLVLRALSGDGERTRLEARVPLSGGRVAATVDLVRPNLRERDVRWTFEWSRRSRAGGPRR